MRKEIVSYMKSIKNIFQVANRELYYQWFSKKIIIVFGVMAILTVLHLVGLHSNIINKYDRYLSTEQYYKEQGLDIVGELKEPLDRTIDGTVVTNNNAIKADYLELASSIRNIKANNIISNTLEYLTFVFATLVFGVYACFVATYDYRNKTYKNISVKYSQHEIILGKITSCIIVMFTTLISVLLISFIGSYVVEFAVKGKVPINDFIIESMNYELGVLPQVLFSFWVVILYIALGFLLSVLMKNMILPTILLLLYGLIVPILGAYDFRNIISYFSHKLFTFTARFTIFEAKPISEIVGLVIINATIILAVISSILVSRKRSAY